MVEPENKLLSSTADGAAAAAKEQQRLKRLSELGLRQSETIPIFEEATQTAAHFLAAPISILGFMDQEIHWFKSAVGLSRLGLMNTLAQTRQILRRESFCSQVVENCQISVINNTEELTDTVLANSQLVQNYGVRAYLGVPLVDSSGQCLGTLAVMDLVERKFTQQNIEILQIIARWSMSEFERNRLLQAKPGKTAVITSPSPSLPFKAENRVDRNIIPPILDQRGDSIQQIKLELLSHLTQELRTPLTSVLGMTSVLGREIYGPLTTKQKEYLEIIQHSGRYLLSLVNEITELGTRDTNLNVLNPVPVNIEMLCQQAINTLEDIASRREQDIRLSIEPGRNRIWLLDKEKVRQMLYHLLFGVIQFSATGSVIRLHVSYKEETLNMTVWVSHPWLGEGMTEVDPYLHFHSLPILEMKGEAANDVVYVPNQQIFAASLENAEDSSHSQADNSSHHSVLDSSRLSANLSREKLGLLLSCQLAEIHGGEITFQGSAESGYRYVISLPLQLPTPAEVTTDIP
jgi:signal transduction histidine kinase